MNANIYLKSILTQHAYYCIIDTIAYNYKLDIDILDLFSSKSDVIIYLQKYCSTDCIFAIIDNNIGDKIKFIKDDEMLIDYFYFENGNILESDENPFNVFINLGDNYCGISFNSSDRIVKNLPLHIAYLDKKIESILFNSMFNINFNKYNNYNSIIYYNNSFELNGNKISVDDFDYNIFVHNGNKLNSKEEFDNWINTEYNFDKFFDENNEPIKQYSCNFKFDE